MAVGFAIAAAVVKIGGAYTSYSAQKRAAVIQYDLDYENIDLFKQEEQEKTKRAEIENRETEGEANLLAGASGFGIGSSLDQYVDSMQALHASDVDWMRTSMFSNIGIMQREAEARKRNADKKADITAFEGLASSFSSMSSAGSAGGW